MLRFADSRTKAEDIAQTNANNKQSLEKNARLLAMILDPKKLPRNYDPLHKTLDQKHVKNGMLCYVIHHYSVFIVQSHDDREVRQDRMQKMTPMAKKA